MARSILCMVLFIGVCVSGCSLFGGRMVKPRVPTYNKKITVVPFREKDLYYLESTVGAEMVELIAGILVNEAANMKVISPMPAFNLIRDKNPASIDWRAVAKELGVDYVLTGNIRTYQSRDPRRDVACYRGTMAIHVKVYEPGGSIALTEFVRADYPSGTFSPSHISVLDTTDEEVLARLRLKAASKIAKFFYAHAPEED